MLKRFGIVFGVVLVLFLAIRLLRWGKTPLPQAVTPEILHGLSFNVAIGYKDGIATLANATATDDQRITLHKIYDTDRIAQGLEVAIEPNDIDSLQALYNSLLSNVSDKIEVDSNRILLDWETSNENDRIKDVEKLLKQCLLHLGVKPGEKFTYTYKGALDWDNLRGYVERNKKAATDDTTPSQ